MSHEDDTIKAWPEPGKHGVKVTYPGPDEADSFERHGWRGIGVPVSLPLVDDAFVALAVDPTSGQPALSVWQPNGPGHSRAVAFWMTPEGARKLAAALLELAGPDA